MTRWLITGAGGLLGRELVRTLADRPGTEVTAADRAALDVTDPLAVKAAVAGHDIVVNTAAWVNADTAESDEDTATAVNGTAVGQLAGACADAGARLVQISTDYVFDGRATAPYAEDAPVAPLNAYGRGKVMGERAVLDTLPDSGYVVRTAWLYSEFGRCFPATMLRLAAQRETLTVVDDQRGQPTWAKPLAGLVADLGTGALAGTASAGVYHGTASGDATWFELARAVFAAAGLDPERVQPVTSAQFGSPAPRPAYSVLGHDRWAAAGLTTLPDWRSLLDEAFREGLFGELVADARAAAGAAR